MDAKMVLNKRSAASEDTLANPLSTVATSADNNAEQVFHRIIQNGNKIQICRALFREFFTGCSIQGLKYFCERRRHWTERIFWMVMFVVAVCLCCRMIHESYTKWDQTPVIIALSTRAKPVWKIPFPAITICPEVKTNSEVINLTETVQRHNKFLSPEVPDNETIETIEALLQICKNRDMVNFTGYGAHKNSADASFIETLYDLSIKLEDVLTECEWRNQPIDCQDQFRPILTEDGHCYTFNSLNSRDIYTDEVAPELLSVSGQPKADFWNLEYGYDDKRDGNNESALETYPYRVLGTGSQNGLSVETRFRPYDLDFMCRGTAEGYKVVLHSPTEIPQPSMNFFRLPHKREVLVSIRPNILETSKELQKYPSYRKLCFLNSEKQLRFFKVYTQHHCELECKSNMTKDECGCVFFSYPRDKGTPICGVAKHACVAEVERKLMEQTFLRSLNDAEIPNESCNCLPACTSINYDVEFSLSQCNREEYIKALYPENNFSQFYLRSQLKVYFKENEFITSKRVELYGLTYFLASCGGLLSLFIGVTTLSFVEIFYYFTLRLVWTLRIYRYGRQSEHGPVNVSQQDKIKGNIE